MDTTQALLNQAFYFHGHKCPAMPLGLRAGLKAMEVLGVERCQDKELHVISETGKGHAAGCFLDGIMFARDAPTANPTSRSVTGTRWPSPS